MVANRLHQLNWLLSWSFCMWLKDAIQAVFSKLIDYIYIDQLRSFFGKRKVLQRISNELINHGTSLHSLINSEFVDDGHNFRLLAVKLPQHKMFFSCGDIPHIQKIKLFIPLNRLALLVLAGVVFERDLQSLVMFHQFFKNKLIL